MHTGVLGKPEGKKLVGSLRHRWENDIKMDFREKGYAGMDWINLA
jgi:hypothetical protein